MRLPGKRWPALISVLAVAAVPLVDRRLRNQQFEHQQLTLDVDGGLAGDEPGRNNRHRRHRRRRRPVHDAGEGPRRPPASWTPSRGRGRSPSSRPTDAAFAELPAGTLDTLLKDPKGELTRILTYHVVPGKVMAADITDGMTAKTVEGDTLTFTIKDGKVYVNDAHRSPLPTWPPRTASST